MPYLIDGNNLVGHMPTLDLSDPGSRRRLARQLAIFRVAEKAKIVLVFDGPVDPDLCQDEFQQKEFQILWPDMEESADSLIQKRIKKQTDMRHFYVVSSDREIQAYARKYKAKILSCKQFYKRLKTALKEHKKAQAMNKEDITLTSLEVDHWLDIFGASDE
jgi:predicted RNA-binding protein with PIN domain